MAVATGREFGLWIGGETVEGSETRELVEPATGEQFAVAQLAGEADVDRAVGAARAALAGPWAKTPPTERSRLLHALADALASNRKELGAGAPGCWARAGAVVAASRLCRRARRDRFIMGQSVLLGLDQGLTDRITI